MQMRRLRRSTIRTPFPVYDYLNLCENPKVKKMLKKFGKGVEKVHFSDHVTKINRRNKEQKRVLLITNKAVYNVDPKKFVCKRQIHIQNIGLVYCSITSDEFILRVPAEYDYHLKSAKRDKAISVLVALYKHLASVHNWQKKTLEQKWKHGKLKDMVVTKLKTQTLKMFKATMAGDVKELESHLNLGADINETYFGKTCLHEAAMRNHIQVANLLIKKNAIMDAQDNDGRTALHWASEKGYHNMIRLLLHFGATVDKKDCVGRTPLHVASVAAHQQVIKHLLLALADVNAVDTELQTPLHMACAKGIHQSVRILLQARCDMTKIDKFGATGRRWALFIGHKKILHFIDNAHLAIPNMWSVVHRSGCNAREKPTVSSKSVKTFGFKEILEGVARRGNWLQIREGWVLIRADGIRFLSPQHHNQKLFETGSEEKKESFSEGQLAVLMFQERHLAERCIICRVIKKYNLGNEAKEDSRYVVQTMESMYNTLKEFANLEISGVPLRNLCSPVSYGIYEEDLSFDQSDLASETEECAKGTERKRRPYSTLSTQIPQRPKWVSLANIYEGNSPPSESYFRQQMSISTAYSPETRSTPLLSMSRNDTVEKRTSRKPRLGRKFNKPSDSSGYRKKSSIAPPMKKYNSEADLITMERQSIKHEKKALLNRSLRSFGSISDEEIDYDGKEEDIEVEPDDLDDDIPEAPPPPPDKEEDSDEDEELMRNNRIKVNKKLSPTQKKFSPKANKTPRINNVRAKSIRMSNQILSIKLGETEKSLGKIEVPKEKSDMKYSADTDEDSDESIPEAPKSPVVKEVNRFRTESEPPPPPPEEEKEEKAEKPTIKSRKMSEIKDKSDNEAEERAHSSLKIGSQVCDRLGKDNVLSHSQDKTFSEATNISDYKIASVVSSRNETEPDPDLYYNIHLIEAKIEGLGDKVNPYVKMWIHFNWKHKQIDGSAVVWPAVRKTTEPRWVTPRALYRVPKDSGLLKLEVFNRLGEVENAEKDELLAHSEMPLEDLLYDLTIEKELKMIKNPQKAKGYIVIRRLRMPPMVKFIYFIRHGQSEWNLAKENNSFVDMLKQIDHPLTVKGRTQAETLALRVEQAKKELENIAKISEDSPHKLTEVVQERSALLENFLQARTVLSSPLCRAVQTACIGLRQLPSVEEGLAKITLNSDCREKRNFGGRDTMSKYQGKQIVQRVFRKLIKLYPHLKYHQRYNKICNTLDIGDTNATWWNTEAETKKELFARIQRLKKHLRFTPTKNIILIGHSHFFRMFLGGSASAEFKKRNPKLAKNMTKNKLDHCAVAATVFNFGRDEKTPAQLEDFRWLFKDGRFLKEKRAEIEKEAKKKGDYKKFTWFEFRNDVMISCENDVELAYGAQAKEVAKLEVRARFIKESGLL